MSYLLINTETNIADNSVVWDGDTSKWLPPVTHIAVPAETTPSVDWAWNEETQAWELGEETVGNGGIGDTWDGVKLTKPQPTEPLNGEQPSSEGGTMIGS